LGTTSKAGLVPLHVWLPLAHPAAPAQVSALMSGVMTKVAVYAFLRLVFDVFAPSGAVPLGGLGAVLVLFAALSAVYGVLSALMEHDLKRLLAFHTVENIGIIFIGIGFALLLRDRHEALAALALSAALFHVLNHSLFKTLLFLGAGVVREEAGSADMEKLGGLIHRMPRLAFAFLIGTMAISALPPLNGFVSEWLTFQALLPAPRLGSLLLLLLGLLAGASLALAAALAAACFVKAYGITFLGRPRSPAAAGAKEAGRGALIALFALAALCLLFGVMPGEVLRALAPVVSARLPGAVSPGPLPLLTLAPFPATPTQYPAAILALLLLTFALLPLFFRRRRTRTAPPWDCGFPDPSPLTQYSASGFAAPLRRIFGSALFAARERDEMPPPGALTPARFEVTLHDRVWEGLYRPLGRLVLAAADRLNPLQFLTIRRHLTLVFALLGVLLLVIGLWM
jgi:NADH:ubiquinone oxidoreductase subunit 5 (subunit L)/multisubunit Na+/H+ antiporter MnhA subunit